MSLGSLKGLVPSSLSETKSDPDDAIAAVPEPVAKKAEAEVAAADGIKIPSGDIGPSIDDGASSYRAGGASGVAANDGEELPETASNTVSNGDEGKTEAPEAKSDDKPKDKGEADNGDGDLDASAETRFSMGVNDLTPQELTDVFNSREAELKSIQEKRRELDAAEAEAQNQLAASGSGGGGSNLLSVFRLLTGGRPTNTAYARAQKNLDQMEADIQQDMSTIRDSLANRMYAVKKDQLEKSFMGIHASGKELADNVANFNSLFSESHNASVFRQNIADYANSLQISEEQALRFVYENKSADPRIQSARKHLDLAMEEPDISAAYRKVKGSEASISEHADRVLKDMKMIRDNFPDRLDAEKAGKAMEETMTGIVKNTPKMAAEKPADVEGDKDLQKRLQELADNISNAISEFFRKISSALGLKNG